jgi:hypothetical protein
VCAAKFTYNPDGTIPTLPWFDPAGVQQVGAFDPYRRVPAATIAWESGAATGPWKMGVRTAQDDKTGVYLTHIANGSYIKVSGVDFGAKPAASFTASVASGSMGGAMELHLDSVDGRAIGSLTVANTGGWDQWQTKTIPVSGATGTHDLFIVFKGDGQGEPFNFEDWKFNPKTKKARVR